MSSKNVKVRWGKLISRKFIAALLAVVIPIINAAAGAPLDTNELIAAIAALISYIFVEGVVDYKGVASTGQLQQILQEITEALSQIKRSR
jgi:uncharacterized membrane protein (DUF106 family)